MKKSLVGISAVLILVTSCKKKELPVQDSEEPVFFISCNVDGIDHRLEAGNSDYYMNTSWSKDSLNNYNLRGDLEQATTTSNKNYGLSILFNNTELIGSTSMFDVAKILNSGAHLLNDEINYGTKQTISFIPRKSIETTATYEWMITDGQTDVRTSQDYEYSDDLTIGKTYSVSLKYADGNGGCVTTHTNVFKAGSRLQTKIVASRDTTSLDLRYNFSYPLPYSGSSFNCTWTFDDGSTTNIKKPSKLFMPGTYMIRLMVVDITTNDTCVSYYQLNATDNNFVCDANYTATFEPVVNSTMFSSATVFLKDFDGTVYSSKLATQPSSSNFEIISVSDYKVNSNGQPTKAVNFRFNCVVQNGQKQKSITNATGVFAVAYKP